MLSNTDSAKKESPNFYIHAGKNRQVSVTMHIIVSQSLYLQCKKFPENLTNVQGETAPLSRPAVETETH